MSRVRLVLVLALAAPASRRALVTAALAALVFAGREAAAPDGPPEVGRVVRVVDGDTIHVQLDGRRENVRYIGVDTPESVKPGTPVQCFAKRAGAFNRRLVAGERVRLVLDAEHRDRYGRLLAYVYTGRTMVNAALVREGYADVLTVPPNVRYAERFRRLANEARLRGTGLWGSCSS